MDGESLKKDRLKKNGISLKHYMKNYKVKFVKDLDDLWSEQDVDGNGWLDKKETKNFMVELSKSIEKDRAKNFDLEKFPALFEQFDEDQNGYLSKGEISQFIKIAFKSVKLSEDLSSSIVVKNDDIELSFNIDGDHRDLSKTLQPVTKSSDKLKKGSKSFDIYLKNYKV